MLPYQNLLQSARAESHRCSGTNRSKFSSDLASVGEMLSHGSWGDVVGEIFR